jgi:hypothetical protein
LTPQEVAGRLAAFIWRSVPDQPLLDAADSGGPGNVRADRTAGETMLSDSRGRAMLDDFVLQWLEIADILRISRDDTAVHRPRCATRWPARSRWCSRTRSPIAPPASCSC